MPAAETLEKPQKTARKGAEKTSIGIRPTASERTAPGVVTPGGPPRPEYTHRPDRPPRQRRSTPMRPAFATAALLLAALPVPAQAQDAPAEAPAPAEAQPADRPVPREDPREDPLLSGEEADRTAARLEARGEGGLTVFSREAREAGFAGRDIAGISDEDLPPKRAGLIREGAFIVEWQGILRPLQNGLWAFSIDRREADRGPEAMVMQPGLKLSEMVRLASMSEEIVTFRVSGEVFSYRGRNYLLPSFFAVVGGERGVEAGDGVAVGDAAGAGADGMAGEAGSGGDGDAGEGQGEAGDGEAGEGEAGEGVDGGLDPGEGIWRRLLERAEGGEGVGSVEAVESVLGIDEDAEALMDRLRERSAEASEGGSRRVSGGGGSAAAGAIERDLIREGTLLGGVPGRVRRVGGGWVFAADNGFGEGVDGVGVGGASSGRPLRLMPGQVLEGIERAVSRYGETVRLSVSGRVFVYDDANFLLPSMYVVELDRTGNLVPGG